MIAPRKKKFIKLIIMAWSVVLVITGSALPVLAVSPVPTDDAGNWVPDAFGANWQIYNPDTQSYDSVSVSSSVTREGLVFDFPINIYGVRYIYFRLDSNVPFPLSSFLFSGSVYYSRADSSVYSPISFASEPLISFRYNNLSDTYLIDTSFYNPFSYSFSSSSIYSDCSRFVFNFYTSEVSGYFRIVFDKFIINGVDIKNNVYISDLENSTEDLDESVEALETALPLPTFDASAFASAEAIVDDYTFFNDGLRFSFMESDLVTHIFILVVYFTCLSIAIFGHAGG